MYVCLENAEKDVKRKILITKLTFLRRFRQRWITSCPHQESNLDLALRRHPFYPLNYEDFLVGPCPTEQRAGLTIKIK